MTTNDGVSKTDLFMRAARPVLRPIVRAMIAQGVTAPMFYRLLKSVYVEIAEQEQGAGATDSRISLATGVHRRDVKAFRTEEPTDDTSAKRKVSVLATVIGRWLADPSYKDAEGTLLSLPRAPGDGPSFEGLVQGVSRDIRPRAVLDELLAQGIVDLADDLVSLRVASLVGPADLEQKLHYFSDNLGDHLSAAVENLLAETPTNFERALYYNNLTPGSADTLEVEARTRATALLLDMNADAAGLQTRDAGDRDANERIRIGIYIYRETEETLDNGADHNGEDNTK